MNHTQEQEPGQSFPMCQLFGHRIVNTLPFDCPMRSQDPLSALDVMQNQAWPVIREGFDTYDLTEGLQVLDQVEVCANCIPRLLSHRIVRRLRRRKGAA